MKVVVKYMRDYNFFENYQRRKESSINYKSPFFFGIVVILLIVILSAGMFAREKYMSVKLENLKFELITIQSSPEYQTANQISKSISALTEYDQYAATALDRISQGNILGTSFMNDLSAILPSNSSLESASINRATASFVFNVPERRTAAELVKHLDESELFIKTSLKSLNFQQDVNRYSVNIDCILKAGEEQ